MEPEDRRLIRQAVAAGATIMVAKAAYDHADEIGEALGWFFKVAVFVFATVLSVLFAALPVVMLLYLLTKLTDLSLDVGQIVTFGTILFVGSTTLLAVVSYSEVARTEKAIPRIASVMIAIVLLAVLGLLVGAGLLIATFGFHAEFPGQFVRWLGDA